MSEIQHSGIKGMHWGIRRFQNSDGSLTPAGRVRYQTKSIRKAADAEIKMIKRQSAERRKIEKAQAKADARVAKAKKKYGPKETPQKPKSISEMSDQEIRDKIARLDLENALKSRLPAAPTPQTSAGKEFTSRMMKNMVEPAVTAAGKELLEKTLKVRGTEVLGLKEQPKPKSALEKAKEQAELAQYQEKVDKARQTHLKTQQMQDDYDAKKRVDTDTEHTNEAGKKYVSKILKRKKKG